MLASEVCQCSETMWVLPLATHDLHGTPKAGKFDPGFTQVWRQGICLTGSDSAGGPLSDAAHAKMRPVTEHAATVFNKKLSDNGFFSRYLTSNTL